MNRFTTLITSTLTTITLACTTPATTEYCDNIDNTTGLFLQDARTTPQTFTQHHEHVLAAINGPYIDEQGETVGVAYIAENNKFGSNAQAHIGGYFVIDRNRNAHITTEKPGTEAFLYIGTQPILLQQGHIHTQATQTRYNQRRAPRAAIGTKTYNEEVCLVATNQATKITMNEWAEELRSRGYINALNLDGGLNAQLATRNMDGTVTNNNLRASKTGIIIYFETRH